MIYYFSGTGNSEWVARRISEATGERIERITSKTMEPIVVDGGERFGIVFPIYAWNLPTMVSDFLKNVAVHKDAYTFAICTCGAEAGFAMRLLQKKMRIDSLWSLVMPDNYIVAFDVEPEDKALAKVRAADAALDEIIPKILAKESGCADVHMGKLPILKTFVASHFFNKYARSAKPFHSTYDCTGCGHCAAVCPVENIHIVDGMPIFEDHCQQCLACIHRCPQRALEYGKSTVKHGRYVFRFTTAQIKGEDDGQV